MKPGYDRSQVSLAAGTAQRMRATLRKGHIQCAVHGHDVGFRTSRVRGNLEEKCAS